MPDEPFDRAEFVAYFRDEAEELLHRIDADVLRLEESSKSASMNPEVVNALFRALHTIKGNAAMLGFADVADLAHGLESLCDLLRTEQIPLSDSCVELLFTGRDLLTTLVASSLAAAPPPTGLREFLDRLGGVAHARDTMETAESFEADVARMLAGESPATLAPQLPGPGRRPTVRVDIERLDHLLNLVGELVINRTRIGEIAASLARAGDDPACKALVESVGLLARTSGEIQESLMKVRMVPIGRVFERFPRIVRDIARTRGKDVRLQIAGASTELDKTIVDDIGEPLMHLLRNCVDHGIESPSIREATGKPRTGTISLNAYHAGNQIVIEMSDDGAGIDRERVRSRAVAAGITARDERLSDQELVDLILRPGFSTADAVSDLSGRGVGMDVVVKKVARLKGLFQVRSEPGLGTYFEIKLPLTLAIISALLVRVGKELYAIPLDAVTESQRVEIGDIRTVRGNEVVTLRDEIVPLIRVADVFGLPAPRDPEKAMAVIVSIQGRHVGLVVDAFEGEQEIVIKPLSDVVGRIPGISGATILGSGAISLILDVHGLVSNAYAGGKIARTELTASEA
ncbi:MAG: chemotaxis protein CheA [Candidatus Tyrphobacter sp.]